MPDAPDHKTVLDAATVDGAQLEGWQRDGSTIVVRYATGDFTSGLRLVNAIGEAAEAADHHPDIALTYPSVEVRLSSHDVGGITGRDIDLARQITVLATAADVPAETA
jgi:4a-hydroxytetrahydrobiopterin dehydratase